MLWVPYAALSSVCFLEDLNLNVRVYLKKKTLTGRRRRWPERWRRVSYESRDRPKLLKAILWSSFARSLAIRNPR